MKKISQFTPSDVTRIAEDRNPIDVLKEIAVDHQLTPNVWSPNTIEKQQKKAILSHPFYQNLSIKDENGDKKPVDRYATHDQESFHSLSSDILQNDTGGNFPSDEAFEKSIKDANEQAKKSISQKKQSYSSRRDTHKVRQMLEKSREAQRQEILKEITPVKYTRNYNAAKSTNGKANPMSNNHGYSSQFEKRKKSRASKMRNKAKFIMNKQESNTFYQRSQSISAQTHKSIHSGSSSQVKDLNEVRDVEKQKKQARIGIHGTQFDKMITKTNNFSKMNRNYGINIENLRRQDGKSMKLFSQRDKKFGNNTDRSFSNVSQQNKTYNSRYNDPGSDSLEDKFEDRIETEEDVRSKTHQKTADDILSLRKQMLHQEYIIKEDQNQELQNLDLSPDQKEKIMQSLYDTPVEIEDELLIKQEPHGFSLNEHYRSPH